jgi:4-amino-4-deoxy-L-arabinose transferase-like glycosyltransferase
VDAREGSNYATLAKVFSDYSRNPNPCTVVRFDVIENIMDPRFRFTIGSWDTPARKRLFLLVVSLALSLASHVVFLRFLPVPWQRNESADFRAFYEPVAHELATGHGFYLPSGKPALAYPPGIPIVYGATFWLSHQMGVSPQIGLRVLQGLLTVGTSVLVSMIGFEMFGARAALLACLLWSTYPFNLWLSKQPSGEPLICVLLAASTLAFLRWSSSGRSAAVWGSVCGTVVAFAALTKPFHIALAVVFVVLAWVCDVRCSRWQRALFSVSVVIAFTLIILPWEVWASRTAGRPIPLCTNDTATFMDGLTFGIGRKKFHNPPPLPGRVTELANDFAAHRRDFKNNRDVIKRLVAEVKQTPCGVALLFLTKATQSWYVNDSHHHERWAVVIQLSYLPLFILGAWFVRDGGRRDRNFLFTVCGVTLYYWGMTTFVAPAILRYMVPALSLLMVLAGNAIHVLLREYGWHPVLIKPEVSEIAL